MNRHLPHVAVAFAAALVMAVSFGCDTSPLRSGPERSVRAAALPVAARRAAADTPPRAPAARIYPLTTEGSDRFTVTPAATRTTVAAVKGNTGGNTRLVWVPPKGDVSTDQQVCATWVAWSGLAQPGLALRVRGDGWRVRAVTVTGNIVWGARFGFNVHEWDTATWNPGGLPVTYAGGAELSRTFGPANGLVSLPWRICARVKGQMLDFKVWPLSRPEPKWGDTRYGRRFKLRPQAVYPGRAGWYAGHLRPGDRLTIEDQVTAKLGR